MPDYPAGFFILPDIRHAGLSGRRSPDIRPDIRHPAYFMKNIRHPASGSCRISGNPAGFWMKNQTIFQALKWHLLPQTIKHVNRMPKIMYKKELELLLNVSIFFGKKSGNPASGSCRISGIRQLSDIRHPAYFMKNIRQKKQIRPNPKKYTVHYRFAVGQSVVVLNRLWNWQVISWDIDTVLSCTD